MTTEGIIFTAIVETDVSGIKAYHVECSCNFKSTRKDRESQAVRTAHKHIASQHSPNKT